MRKSNFAARPLARCAYWRLLSALVCLLSLAAVPAGGAEGVNWSSRALTAGLVDVATGGYRVSRVLGVANFSPEFVMPLEAVYESASTRTGLLGYRWSCPQLESRVIPGPKPERNSDAPETATWRAPWGEEITLIRKKDVAKGSPLAQIDAGALKHVSSAAFYAPYGDWEATRAGTSWTVKGRADRPRAGWEFAYRDTRLEKATAPGGRSIAFAYENGRLAAVAQDGVAFVELSYAKGALAGMKVNGVKVALEIKEIPVVTLPETLGAKPAVTRRPALAAWAVGELAAETFSYNDSGWLCGMARDRATVAFKLHAETPARRQEALAARAAVEAAAAKAAAARKAGAKNLEKLQEQEAAARKRAGELAADPADGTLLADGVFTYSYGNGGVTATDASGQSSTLRFNPETGVLSVSGSDGRSQEVFYYRRHDVAYNGKLRQVVDGRGRELANYRYDSDTGNLVRLRSLGRPDVHYGYDKDNRLEAVSRAEPDGSLRPLARVAYGKDGNPARVEILDRGGKAVRAAELKFDRHRQLVRVATDEGSESRAYTAGGRVKETVDRFGRRATWRYDKYNRLVGGADARGVEFALQYDASGLVSRLTRRLPGEARPFATAEFARDRCGRLVGVTDQDGRATRRELDAVGRVLKEILPDGSANGYERDELGRLRKVVDARGNPIEFVYARSGDLAERVTAVGQRAVFERDRDGLLRAVRRLNAAGEVASEAAYGYDDFDRVVRVDFGGGHWRELSYDGLGRPATVKVSDGETTRTVTTEHDDFDRPVKIVEVAVRGGKAETTTIEREYAASGRLAKERVTFPDGTATERSWAHDRHGRLVAETVDGRTVRYAYGADGEVETQEIAGAVVKLARDKLGRLTEKRVLGKDGEVLACLRYFYAPGGALTAREINGVHQELVTDEKGQLTAVKDRDGNVLERYVYDPVGNLLEKTVRGRSTKYEYDAANQLVAQTTDAGTPQEKRVEFAYDGAGRMTREGQREYRYGGLDKVVAVLEAGRTVAEFAYGADGQLANITRRNGENERLWWRGLALTRRDYLNGKEVASSERYLNEPHATGGNPVLAWEGKAAPESAKEQARAAATRLLFNDMLGSTLAVLDGDKAQDTGMTLFGETPDGQGAGFFTGKPHVDEFGYAFLFRNYRPDKAKWQTADPLGYPDGWNALAYVNNGVDKCFDFQGTVIQTKTINGIQFRWNWDDAKLSGIAYYDTLDSPAETDYPSGNALGLTWKVWVFWLCTEANCKSNSTGGGFWYKSLPIKSKIFWVKKAQLDVSPPSGTSLYESIGTLAGLVLDESLSSLTNLPIVDSTEFNKAKLKRPLVPLDNLISYVKHVHIYE